MAQRTHAAGAAMAMAMPVMAMGTELQRTPSMAMPVPTATNDSPTQSGSTFHFVFMLFSDSRIATEWAICHEQMEPSYLKGIVCDFRGRERREGGEALGIFRAEFVKNAGFQGGGCEDRSSLLCRSIGFHRLGRRGFGTQVLRAC